MIRVALLLADRPLRISGAAQIILLVEFAMLGFRSRFSSKHSGKRWRSSDRWRIWRLLTLFLTVAAVWWFGFRPIVTEQGWVEVRERFALCGDRSSGAEREAGCVVDGDTVVIGFGANRRRIRFIGYDTPELDGGCQTERGLAKVARLQLHDWLAEGSFEWDGAQDPPYDQYGRELREVRRTDSDKSSEYLAATMIKSGLASDNGWGTLPQDWCR